MNDFPIFRQLDTMDCGPTCLRMIAKHFGKNYSLQTLREKIGINREGVSMAAISRVAENLGLRTLVVRVGYEKLINEAPVPFIAHWKQNHFVVVYKIQKNKVFVADPAEGKKVFNKKEFITNWAINQMEDEPAGIVTLFEVTPRFNENEDEKQVGLNFGRILQYLFNYKKLLVQLFIGLLMGSAMQLVLPFLSQAIIDIGINTRNINFINLILVGQLVLYAGRTVIEFIRSWILLHISSRININILSDFFAKLLRLPLSYFDTKHQGDLLQRINDHHNIESFLTDTVISTIFAIFNFIVLGFTLAFFNLKIFLLFLLASAIYIGWVVIFQKRRRQINIKKFEIGTKNQNIILQIIDGIHDIKLNNSEQQKRWEWENIQARLFKLNIQSLGIKQIQYTGALFINEGKNILITFFAAMSVLNGEMTLGMMLSLQYIIGQLNSPIEHFISFIQLYQDAQLSLQRLNDIHQVKDEEPEDSQNITELPFYRNIRVENLSFIYPGTTLRILENINLVIPEGKTTAIVGTSGSGKTTLLKLFLKFYETTSGQIYIGNVPLARINHHSWREKCGVVMQDGFIFSDTIARNIAVGQDYIDIDRLYHAVRVANIFEFIETLPLGFSTKIGAEGNGLSQVQKQRILIARAVYKNPDFIFFDEATNALDANNEKVIMQNLNEFFRGKTVVVVAHRLSTVRNADQIIVISKGKITESGTNDELINLKGEYYELVKNQLELGD